MWLRIVSTQSDGRYQYGRTVVMGSNGNVVVMFTFVSLFTLFVEPK